MGVQSLQTSIIFRKNREWLLPEILIRMSTCAKLLLKPIETLSFEILFCWYEFLIFDRSAENLKIISGNFLR